MKNGFVLDAGALIALERRAPFMLGILDRVFRGSAERAIQIGVTIGKTSHPDIVDVHVALAAAERGHAVLTSDDADIAHVDADLVIVHV